MVDQITYVKELLMNYADLILSSSPKFTPRSDIHQWLYIEVSKTNNTMIFRMDFNIQDLRVTGQNLMGLYSLFHIKGNKIALHESFTYREFKLKWQLW